MDRRRRDIFRFLERDWNCPTFQRTRDLNKQKMNKTGREREKESWGNHSRRKPTKQSRLRAVYAHKTKVATHSLGPPTLTETSPESRLTFARVKGEKESNQGLQCTPGAPNLKTQHRNREEKEKFLATQTTRQDPTHGTRNWLWPLSAVVGVRLTPPLSFRRLYKSVHGSWGRSPTMMDLRYCGLPVLYMNAKLVWCSARGMSYSA